MFFFSFPRVILFSEPHILLILLHKLPRPFIRNGFLAFSLFLSGILLGRVDDLIITSVFQANYACLASAKEWMTEGRRHPCHQPEKQGGNLPESFFASSSSSAKFMEMEGASEGVLVLGFM